MRACIYLPAVLDGLTELSDLELQMKLWVHGDENGMSSFTEAVCVVFDDGCVTRAMEAGSIDEPLLGLFKDLNVLIDKIPELAAPSVIIEHSVMPELRTVALNLLQILQEQKNASTLPRRCPGSRHGGAPMTSKDFSSQSLMWLQEWFSEQCNGDWEHQFGVEISTLDNPGWKLIVDLVDTEFENRPFKPISDERTDNDWLFCSIENQQFRAYCGVHNLQEAISVFQVWVQDG